MNHKVSAAGRHNIKNEEGWKLEPYICPAGKWTIGAGHRIYDKGLPGLLLMGGKWSGVITEQAAEDLLTNDLKIVEKAINDLVHVPLNQNQVDALAAFILNIGRQAFAGSTLLRLLNAKQYKRAADQFERWCHDDHGAVIKGLLKRQQRTKALFLK